MKANPHVDRAGVFLTAHNHLVVLRIGIPGSPADAIPTAALVFRNVHPSPMQMIEHPDVFYGIIATFRVSLILTFGALGWVFSLAKITILPFVTRPISAVIAVGSVLFVIWPYLRNRRMTAAGLRAILEHACDIRSFPWRGYCMGGRHTVNTLAAKPRRIKAAASIHGGRLVTSGEDSPHLLISKLQGPATIALATDDDACRDSHQDMIRPELDRTRMPPRS